MNRNFLRRSDATDGTVESPDDAEESHRVGRRALLTRGAVVAGAVSAGAAIVATAAPASAATNSPILQSELNTAAANAAATEIAGTSSSAPTPTLILTNTGSTGTAQASPPLRISPAVSALYEPSSATVPGDVVATGDGNLWFTHKTTSGAALPATVHTDATSNSFVPLTAPYRILDTRISAGRAHILDASGNLDSIGRLLGGHTIHVDLGSLVTYGDAVTSNLTVIDPLNNGWVLVWPGDGTKPDSSSIAFYKGQAIANLTVCGIGHSYSASKTDTIAITASVTTHVILDVAGFYVANVLLVNSAYNPFTASASVSASQSVVRTSQSRTALNP